MEKLIRKDAVRELQGSSPLTLLSLYETFDSNSRAGSAGTVDWTGAWTNYKVEDDHKEDNEGNDKVQRDDVEVERRFRELSDGSCRR